MKFVFRKIVKIILLFCFLYHARAVNVSSTDIEKKLHIGTDSLLDLRVSSNVEVDSTSDEDANLNFTQLAQKYGLKCEEFEVITEDNYILKIFHIPGDKTRPVLLTHGFLDSADSYILRGKKSLAYVLAKNGYDAWYLNVRGNKYSRRHVILNPDTDNAFWDCSFHEYGVKDLAATLDFVLDKTKQKQLSLIGFSQGNQICYILASMKSEYNAKIKLIIALAPVAFLNNLPLPTCHLKLVMPFINKYCDETGNFEVFKKGSIWDLLPRFFCTNKLVVRLGICEHGFIFPMAGPDPDQLETEFVPIVMSHFPTSTSAKNFEHMVQLQYRKKFGLFDNGPIGNLIAYGAIEPPDYPLNKITAPVALLVGENDRLADIDDVLLLREQLQNNFYYIVKRKEMNHFDFVWGKDMTNYLFPVVLDLLKNQSEIFANGYE